MKFYLTTPIYYINDKPHIGHAYTTIIADALSRYNRLKGRDVYFLTGTDENSQKNIEAAERHFGKKNLKNLEIQTYLDEMAALWQRTWDELKITNNDFIRTTEERHLAAVNKFFKLIWDKGDIYKGLYEGYYCGGCESFISESDLADGRCPIHKKKPQKLKEENYFFKLTKYRAKLLKHIKKNPDFIMPKSRRAEILAYIKNFLGDISITRQSLKWGIAAPNIKNQVLYVWFDALINYLSAVGFSGDKIKFKKYWPADLHLVGKDIIKFHGALWPAMLLSAGLPLPRQIFAHGFFTVDGEKMSKSLGNVINPIDVVLKYGYDALRYYLLREIPLGEDGDFSYLRLEERYNGDLANGLGNLVSRVFTMAEKYFDGKAPAAQTASLYKKRARGDFWKLYEKNFEELKLHSVLNLVWEEIAKCDKIIDKEKPWELSSARKQESEVRCISGQESKKAKSAVLADKKARKQEDRLAEVIYELLERIRQIAWALWPFLPDASEKILEKFGIIEEERKKSFRELQKWGGLMEGQRVEKGEMLFPRLE